MEVTDELVDKLATLAKLEFKGDKKEQIKEDFQKMLNFVEKLEELDTDGVEPMTSVVEMSLRQRDDEITDGSYPEKVLANGPETALGFYTVPKVVE